MRLDRLKELTAKIAAGTHSHEEYAEYLRLAPEMLPGLLRVCDAHMSLLLAMNQWDGFTYEGAYERAEKKLWELLG